MSSCSFSKKKVASSPWEQMQMDEITAKQEKDYLELMDRQSELRMIVRQLEAALTSAKEAEQTIFLRANASLEELKEKQYVPFSVLSYRGKHCVTEPNRVLGIVELCGGSEPTCEQELLLKHALKDFHPGIGAVEQLQFKPIP